MKEVYVFGRGNYFKTKRASIEAEYKIAAFLDNAVDIDSSVREEDKPVYHPSYVKGCEGANVLIAAIDFVAMYYQLKSYGLPDENILFSFQLLPAFDRFEQTVCDTNIVVKKRDGKLYLEAQGESEGSVIETTEDLKALLLNRLKESDPMLQMICRMDIEPISRKFGREFGTPIDRIYIEKFLDSQKACIKGEVMEVASNQYTKKFGAPDVTSNVMHIYGWKGAKKINLETGEGIEENSIDCFICTQTLQMIYDMSACMKNIKRMLKWGGSALITFSGNSQLSMIDYTTWGECWRVTPFAAKKMAIEQFGSDNVEVYSYGNVKTVMAFLAGVPAEALDKADFEENDEQYPLIVGLVVRK